MPSIGRTMLDPTRLGVEAGQNAQRQIMTGAGDAAAQLGALRAQGFMIGNQTQSPDYITQEQANILAAQASGMNPFQLSKMPGYGEPMGGMGANQPQTPFSSKVHKQFGGGQDYSKYYGNQTAAGLRFDPGRPGGPQQNLGSTANFTGFSSGVDNLFDQRAKLAAYHPANSRFAPQGVRPAGGTGTGIKVRNT